MERLGFEFPVRLISVQAEKDGRLVRAPADQAHLLILEDDPNQHGYATGAGIEYPQRERLISPTEAAEYCIHPAIGSRPEWAQGWLAAAAGAGYRVVGH